MGQCREIAGSAREFRMGSEQEAEMPDQPQKPRWGMGVGRQRSSLGRALSPAALLLEEPPIAAFGIF
jgi:hypothetical protein